MYDDNFSRGHHFRPSTPGPTFNYEVAYNRLMDLIDAAGMDIIGGGALGSVDRPHLRFDLRRGGAGGEILATIEIARDAEATR